MCFISGPVFSEKIEEEEKREVELIYGRNADKFQWPTTYKAPGFFSYSPAANMCSVLYVPFYKKR